MKKEVKKKVKAEPPKKKLKKEKPKRKTGKRIFGIFVAIIILLSILHVALHVIVYQTNIPLAKTIGISGNAIGKLQITETFEQDIKQSYPQISGISKIVLIGEWALLIILITFSAVRTKINLKKEHLSLRQVQTKDKSKTDIDLLYDILKEKKSVRISSVAQLFKVKKETVKEWAEILENGNLANVSYPRFGEPEITFIDNGEEKKQ